MGEPNKLEQTLSELETKLNTVKCWEKIATTQREFLTTTDLGKINEKIYGQISKELREFAQQKATEIIENHKLEKNNESFTSEEILILKKMASKVSSMQQQVKESSTPVENKTNSKESVFNKSCRVINKTKLKEVKEQEDYPAVGKSYRTATHDRLTMISNPSGNVLPTYSTIEVKEIKDDKATVQFLSQGGRGVIPVSDIIGFEHLE